MHVSLTLPTTHGKHNKKVGDIPVSTSSAATCPSACPLKAGGCYARNFPLRKHWDAVSAGERGTDYATFLQRVRALPKGQTWRHNQAGDLPGEGDRIDTLDLIALVEANEGRHGFTYTHKPPTLDGNGEAIAYANEHGFTINLSADTLAEADELADLAIGPVVVVLPRDAQANTKTPAGRTVVVCPATTHENVTCATCKLCARVDRPTIVGFPAHGQNSAKRADLIAKGNA